VGQGNNDDVNAEADGEVINRVEELSKRKDTG
jgi:hypothetical protein